MSHGSWLVSTLVYLAAAVIAVPVSRFLGLGTIIGYLAAGIVIGPWGFGLVTDAAQMLEFAEFGVVLMLFLVGLELEPKRLWALRRSIFGGGLGQYAGSTALLFAVGLGIAAMAGVTIDWRVVLVGALALAMSSTAIGLSVLEERHVGDTAGGRGVIAVALLQDIAAIPVLALVPLLAAEGAAAAPRSGWIAALEAIAVIAAIVFGGRLLLRPFLRWIAGSATPEIFTAAALALVVGIAALMQAVGLSMALGAFLAGVLLADSEYRRELEADIEPFKGLLLGLFFIAVGMGLDVSVLLARPLAIAVIVAGFLALKAAVLWLVARRLPVAPLERPLFILLLAQGGEFGFVVLQAAAGGEVIDAAFSATITAAIAISMLATPLLLVAADRFWVPRIAGDLPRQTMAEIDEPQQEPVIIAGFGRYGQVVARMLYANGIRATVLEHDADQVETLRRFGWRVFYGDATRLDLLRVAGAERARILVLAIDDVNQSLEVADLAREHFPKLAVVARARNVQHWIQLHERGVKFIERETLDSALMSARSVLELMGLRPHRARTLAMRFRRHSVAQLFELAPHFRDESKLISAARRGRQQLEQLFARERSESEAQRAKAGWQAAEAGEGEPPAA